MYNNVLRSSLQARQVVWKRWTLEDGVVLDEDYETDLDDAQIMEMSGADGAAQRS